MKKILIVNNNLKIGGIQKALVNLLNEISNKYDITLFLFSDFGECFEDIPANIKIITATSILKVLGESAIECKKQGIKYLIAKIFFNIITKILGNKIAIKLACLFEPKIEGYDIAISYMHDSPKNIFYGGTNEFVLSRVIARKKVSFVHCDYKNYGGDILYARKMYSQYDKIAFCSKGCMDTFVNIIPELKNKCMVIYNCVNINKIINMANKNTVIYKSNEIPVVTIGRMTFEKGMDVCLKLIHRYINEKNKNIHLYLIGDGDDKEKLEEMKVKLKLENHVTFCGKQMNVYRYMKNAKVLLLLSKHEAAPVVFDEANVLKIPVLSTATTSVKEMILDRNAGLIGRNEEELVQNLDIIIKENIFFKSHIMSRGNDEALKQFYEMISEMERIKNGN